jgi:Tfp pilus assembly protein PilO
MEVKVMQRWSLLALFIILLDIAGSANASTLSMNEVSKISQIARIAAQNGERVSKAMILKLNKLPQSISEYACYSYLSTITSQDVGGMSRIFTLAGLSVAMENPNDEANILNVLKITIEEIEPNIKGYQNIDFINFRKSCNSDAFNIDLSAINENMNNAITFMENIKKKLP